MCGIIFSQRNIWHPPFFSPPVPIHGALILANGRRRLTEGPKLFLYRLTVQTARSGSNIYITLPSLPPFCVYDASVVVCEFHRSAQYTAIAACLYYLTAYFARRAFRIDTTTLTPRPLTPHPSPFTLHPSPFTFHVHDTPITASELHHRAESKQLHRLTGRSLPLLTRRAPPCCRAGPPAKYSSTTTEGSQQCTHPWRYRGTIDPSTLPIRFFMSTEAVSLQKNTRYRMSRYHRNASMGRRPRSGTAWRLVGGWGDREKLFSNASSNFVSDRFKNHGYCGKVGRGNPKIYRRQRRGLRSRRHGNLFPATQRWRCKI